jgi:hypothetical protein
VPQPLQNLSPASTASPQLRQNFARDRFFSPPASADARVPDEERREANCQIRAAKINRPPAITATNAQLIPKADAGVLGNAGFWALVLVGGKRVADN